MNDADIKTNEPVASYRPDLPDWGCYPHWPADGEASVLPEDLENAQGIIPSRRILSRRKWDGEHYWLYYGTKLVRVRPAIWVAAPNCDLEVGQQIELLPQQGENDAGIYHIREITLSQDGGSCEFWLRRGTLPIEKRFSRSDLRPLKEQHQLNMPYFEHSAPVSRLPEDLDLLNVGNLLES